jgi:hypothetical protein
MGEKFSTAEMAALRSELLKGGLDSRQTAELLQFFLMGHGYGVSHDTAVDAASRVEGAGLSLEALRTELENLALAM